VAAGAAKEKVPEEITSSTYTSVDGANGGSCEEARIQFRRRRPCGFQKPVAILTVNVVPREIAILDVAISRRIIEVELTHRRDDGLAPRICGKRVFHGGNDLDRIDDAPYVAP
jgi:hypothetical protein